MADFVAVLRRAIGNLETNTPETRAALYDKARGALLAQLRALDPPLSDDELGQQAEGLDLAIARLEEEYAADDHGDDAPEDQPGSSGFAGAGPRYGEGPETRGYEDERDDEDQHGGPGRYGATAYAGHAGGRRDDYPHHADDEDALAGPAPGQRDRARDGRFAGEEAAARSRAAAAAFEAEAASAPPPRRRGRRTALWGLLALVLLVLAGVGAWQSDLIFGTADRTLDRVASQEPAKIEERLPANDGSAQDGGPQSEFQAPAQTGAPAQDADGQTADQQAGEAPAQQGEQQTGQQEVQQDVPPAADAERPALTDQPTPPGASAQALLIEEADGGPGSANTLGGSVQWELVSENGAQGEAQVISGTITIPDRDLSLLLTVRRNTDAELPASHTIELIFEAPEDFAGGGIANVPGLIMKATPRSTGQPLVGAVVAVTDNFFLVGLSESDLDRERNVREMLARDFMDIPLVYEGGGRAVLSIAKGEEGRQVFQRAFDAWQ